MDRTDEDILFSSRSTKIAMAAMVVMVSTKEKNIKIIKARYPVRDVLDALWYSFPTYSIEWNDVLYVRKD